MLRVWGFRAEELKLQVWSLGIKAFRRFRSFVLQRKYSPASYRGTSLSSLWAKIMCLCGGLSCDFLKAQTLENPRIQLNSGMTLKIYRDPR